MFAIYLKEVKWHLKKESKNMDLGNMQIRIIE